MIKANIELWKDVKDYEGLYQVSTLGRVRSLDKYIDVKIRNVDKVLKRGKILKPVYDKNGYLKVFLCKNGKGTYFRVHRLVAKTFIPNPDNLPCVNHKDEDKTNNYPYNLEWCTVKYNNNYGTRNERAAKSNTNGKRSKKVYQYNLKGNLVNIWPSTKECNRNGYKQSCVINCCVGKRKTYKKYIWSYKPINNFNINNYLPKDTKNDIRKSKPIIQYDLQGNFIKEWASAAEAGRNGYNSFNISSCCNNKLKSHKNYIWKFKYRK